MRLQVGCVSEQHVERRQIDNMKAQTKWPEQENQQSDRDGKLYHDETANREN